MTTQDLDEAFRATTYRVTTPDGVFDLRIGKADAAFDAFLRRRQISCWAVLTACNPDAVRDDAGNAQRQQRLRERLGELAWSYLPASNRPEDPGLPPEPGFLLLQVGEEEADRLAAEFSQLAYVCGDIGGASRLVYANAKTS